MRERAPQKHIFSGLKIHRSAYIQSMHFPFITDGMTLYYSIISAVMSQNIWGAIFARERSDQARGSVVTERGEGVRGCPPPTVGSFFIFRLENVQSGAYLRRKFRLDDMYYIIITCMELKISHGLILLGGGGAFNIYNISMGNFTL